MKPQLKSKHVGRLLSILCLSLFFTHFSFAQNYTENQLKAMRIKLINNSEYILQTLGYIHWSYFVDKNNKTKSVDVYLITDVLRGPQELKNKKIIVISEAPGTIVELETNHIYGDDLQVLHPLHMNRVSQGIHKCKKSSTIPFTA